MDPFVGQLSLVGFNFPPTGWASAAGQLMPISQNTALFSLLGTYYGGDGRSTFALPNLQETCAVGQGQSSAGSQYYIGQTGGEPNVTLLATEVPPHTHTAHADVTIADQISPSGNAFARPNPSTGNLYSKNTSPLVGMNPNSLSPAGSNMPHNNMMPYLALNWIIALQGVFPPRS
jgi:microcystin-dependent protein